MRLYEEILAKFHEWIGVCDAADAAAPTAADDAFDQMLEHADELAAAIVAMPAAGAVGRAVKFYLKEWGAGDRDGAGLRYCSLYGVPADRGDLAYAAERKRNSPRCGAPRARAGATLRRGPRRVRQMTPGARLFYRLFCIAAIVGIFCSGDTISQLVGIPLMVFALWESSRSAIERAAPWPGRRGRAFLLIEPY